MPTYAFAAMFERIKVNFTEWCEGTLNKLERLKHLCEVLDPELYAQLTLQQDEDPFVLFFGMVLIECRREFSFQDGLHLFEVLWSAAMHRDAPSLDDVSRAKWASFMTSVSPDIVSQTFGETGVPYSTHPLDEDSVNVIMSPGSRSSSRRSQSSARLIPRPGSASMRSENRSDETQSLHSQSKVASPTLSKDRNLSTTKCTSLPESSYIMVNTNNCSTTTTTETKSEGNLHTGERGESADNMAELVGLPHTTEMADMSSVSSSKSKTNGLSVGGSPVLKHKDSEAVCGSVEGPDVFLEECLEGKEDRFVGETRSKSQLASASNWSQEAAQKVGTFPRPKHKQESPQEAYGTCNTLPRSHSSIPPASFLHNLSRPSLSSPYVSGIRALDPRLSYPDTNLDPFKDECSSSSPNPSSPNQLSPYSTSPSRPLSFL